MVPPAGFQPATFSLGPRHSMQLSYGGINFKQVISIHFFRYYNTFRTICLCRRRRHITIRTKFMRRPMDTFNSRDSKWTTFIVNFRTFHHSNSVPCWPSSNMFISPLNGSDGTFSDLGIWIDLSHHRQLRSMVPLPPYPNSVFEISCPVKNPQMCSITKRGFALLNWFWPLRLPFGTIQRNIESTDSVNPSLFALLIILINNPKMLQYEQMMFRCRVIHSQEVPWDTSVGSFYSCFRSLLGYIRRIGLQADENTPNSATAYLENG